MILGYCRVSTVEQASDGRTSLADQERIIRGIAMIRRSADPVMFRDVGVSGSVPLAERPAGAQLFSMVQAGDVVVASKLDRMFRDIVDAFETAKRFKDMGVDLILTDINSDPVTGHGTGKLLFGVLAVVADFERDRIAERMREGRTGKLARGGHIGGEAPYGWRKVGSGRDAMLVENDAEQDVIARIVVLYGQTGSLNQTAIKLNSSGISARVGKWTREQVRRVVKRANVARGCATPTAEARTQ